MPDDPAQGATHEDPQGGQPAAQPDVAASFARLLGRSDDAVALAQQLFNERYQDREKHRTLQEQLDTLRTQVPGEGQVILSQADAEALNAYRELGEVESLRATQETARTARRELGLRTAAEAAKYSVAALTKLAPEGSEFDVQEGTAYLVQGEDRHPLTEYAEQHWPEFLVALQGPAAGGGTAYPPQSGGGGKAPSQTSAAVAKTILARAYQTSKE